MNKLFKFWRWRLQVKLNKLPNKKRVEVLANKLIKELNIKIDSECHGINLWIFNKERMGIDANSTSTGFSKDIFVGKYTGN